MDIYNIRIWDTKMHSERMDCLVSNVLTLNSSKTYNHIMCFTICAHLVKYSHEYYPFI